MRALLLLSFDFPETDGADAAAVMADVVKRIDPPSLPFFAREARITLDPHASVIERWLDEE